MTFHPDAAKLVAEGRADRHSGAAAGRAERAYREAAAEERRDTGMLVPIAVGVTVRTDPAKLRGADDEVAQQDGAMAGLVLSVHNLPDTLICDDGSDGWVRVFNPHAPRGRRFSRWPYKALDLWATEPADPYKLTDRIRMMWREVSTSGLFDEADAQIIGDMQRLTARLMTQGGRK